MVAAGAFCTNSVARLPCVEGIEHEVDGIVDGHHEARHVRIGDRQGLAAPGSGRGRAECTEPREAITLP